jgi:nicotinamidase-related amidase
MLVGDIALLVVDIQRGGSEPLERSGIPVMDGYDGVIANAERIVSAAREAGLPVVFFQEVHRRSGVDFGRELDGVEGIHCVEGEPGTELWPTLTPGVGEYHIAKRRYSCFFATELEILLKGLDVSTVVLVGGLTDVCVHYTFVDAHQRDFFARVVDDCVIGSTIERHEAALDAMEYLQTGARRSTEEIVSGFLATRPPPVTVGAAR